MTNQYHATPYDISATGFYFASYDEYVEKAASHKNEYGDPVEEYEIQFIDGDNCKLFEAIGVNQANLEQWFNDFEDLDDDDAVKVIYLTEHLGYSDPSNLLDKLEDVCLFEGTAEEYAWDYIEGTGLLNDLPDLISRYFDTESFARDLVLGGDITEARINGTDYVVWGV